MDTALRRDLPDGAQHECSALTGGAINVSAGIKRYETVGIAAVIFSLEVVQVGVNPAPVGRRQLENFATVGGAVTVRHAVEIAGSVQGQAPLGSPVVVPGEPVEHGEGPTSVGGRELPNDAGVNGAPGGAIDIPRLIENHMPGASSFGGLVKDMKNGLGPT